MDLVWDDFRCDNKNLNWENIVTTTLIKKYLKKNKNSFLNKLMNKINTLWRNK